MSLDLDERIAAYYGEGAASELARAAGLIHVAALWTGGPGSSRVSWPAILIRAGGPRSAADRFALELSRARADAILITGQIVRDEPELVYGRPGAGTPHADALLRWREQAAGKAEPPRLLILTRSADFDLDHPVLRSWARPLVFTGEARAAQLRAELDARGHVGVEVVGHSAPSLAAAVAHLRGRGCATITLEAGPSVVGPLYAGEGPGLSELLLSFYAGALAPALRGPSFAPAAQIRRRFTQRSSVVAEPDGEPNWTLTRWRPRIAP